MFKMDMKQKTIVIVAVIVVILAGVYGAQALNDRHDDARDETATVDFLIQDHYGVYFWVEGSGVTVYDAFKDAASTYSIPYVPSVDENTSAENGITSMYGLSTFQDEKGDWIYWNQLYYNGSSWEMTPSYMSGLAAKDYGTIAIVYAAYGKAVPADSTPDVLSLSTEGTVFTIESPSGMYFNIAGNGENVQVALGNAMAAYNFPYTANDSQYGGIKSLFGLSMYQNESGEYIYWEQLVVDNGAWVTSMTGMPSISVSDCSKMLIVFHVFGNTTNPVLPPVGA